MKRKGFVFNERNLLENMHNYKLSGKEINKLECNFATVQRLPKLHIDETFDPVEHLLINKSAGIIGRYESVPIAINEAVEDGVILIS